MNIVNIFSQKKVGDVIQVLYKHYFNLNVLRGGTGKRSCSVNLDNSSSATFFFTTTEITIMSVNSTEKKIRQGITITNLK